MERQGYRALVVDDEPAVRMITIRELSRNGFTCDAARDGLHAKELLADTRYDAVVTDLRMPEMNGHALAVEILDRPNPPVVVVLTGVTEPRLAKDLIARGVDDILFKPIDQSILASKVRALVDRRASLATRARPHVRSANADRVEATASTPHAGLPPTDPAELDARLGELVKIAPISQAALDVVKMTAEDTVQTRQLTRAIEIDASLTAELLRIANSSLHNPTSRAATGVEEAVLRIGQKRIGELALAVNTRGALKAETISWMDVTLLWRRSIAAGLAVDLLIAKSGHSPIGTGLYLSAIMHPLGRVVLSTLYRDRYEEMLQLCRQSGEALQTYEDRVFQRTHTEVMAQMLEAWQIPAAVFEPLKYVRSPPSMVSQLAEPLRTRVELVQLAIVISRFSIGIWEPWDRMYVPGSETLHKLGVESLEDFILRIRLEMEAVGQLTELEATRPLRSMSGVSSQAIYHELAYCNLSTLPFDFVGEILPSMGVRPQPCLLADLSPEIPAVVNCCGVPIEKVTQIFTPRGIHVLVRDVQDHNDLLGSTRLLTLPNSFGNMRATVLKLVDPERREYDNSADSAPPVSGSRF
jgi:HD-like signal output (HDOD) protein/DNA-binding NarL/FixJ family response regulator